MTKRSQPKSGLSNEEVSHLTFGTRYASYEDCLAAVETAIAVGYRRFDTGEGLYSDIGNCLSDALQASGMPRSDFLVAGRLEL